MRPSFKRRIGSLSFLLPAGMGVTAAVYVRESFRLNFGRWDVPEEGFVPLIFGVFLLGGSIFLTVIAYGRPEEKPVLPPKGELKPLAMLVGAWFIYLILLPILGFTICTFLLVIVSAKTMGVRVSVCISLAFGVVLVSYLLFTLWLKVPLPSAFFLH